jgi:hypothetical protein
MKIPFGNVFEGFLTRFYGLYMRWIILRWIKCIRAVIYNKKKRRFFLSAVFFHECRAPPVGAGHGHPAWTHP